MQSISHSNTPGSRGSSKKKRKMFMVHPEFDIWGFGLILLQLVHHRPFDQMPEMVNFIQQLNGQSQIVSFTHLSPLKPDVPDDELEKLMWMCLVNDPDKRITISSILVSKKSIYFF
jgi:hypothetical protein